MVLGPDCNSPLRNYRSLSLGVEPKTITCKWPETAIKILLPFPTTHQRDADFLHVPQSGRHMENGWDGTANRRTQRSPVTPDGNESFYLAKHVPSPWIPCPFPQLLSCSSPVHQSGDPPKSGQVFTYCTTYFLLQITRNVVHTHYTHTCTYMHTHTCTHTCTHFIFLEYFKPSQLSCHFTCK